MLRVSTLQLIFLFFLTGLTFSADGQEVTNPDRQIFLTVSVKSGKEWVKGLKVENFSLIEGKHQLPIEYFSDSSEPVSVGILVDRSLSMKLVQFSEISEALTAFEKKLNPESEIFVSCFNTEYQPMQDFSQSRDTLRTTFGKLAELEPLGETLLLDAYKAGIDEFRDARFRKKVLIVLSDGDAAESKTKPFQIKRHVKQSGVTVFSVVLDYPTLGYLNRLFAITELTSVSGGETFFVPGPDTLDRKKAGGFKEALLQIAEDLENQYMLGFRVPGKLTGKSKDGWHKIEVKVHIPASLGIEKKPKGRSRTGYYLDPGTTN